MSNADMWQAMIDNNEFLDGQYDILAGKLPTEYNEAVLVVNNRHEVPDLMLYSLGLKTQEDFNKLLTAAMNGDQMDSESLSFSFDEILSLEYPLVLPTDVYAKEGDKWVDKSEDKLFMTSLLAKAEKVHITGIVEPSEDAAAVSTNTFVGYTAGLTEKIVNDISASEIVKEQIANPDKDVFTGIEFAPKEAPAFTSMDEVMAFISTLDPETAAETQAQLEQAKMLGIPEENLLEMFSQMIASEKTDATYDGNIEKLRVVSLDNPSGINLYANSFDNKDAVAAFITQYNTTVEEGGEITYTDFIGLLLSSVTNVINGISAILIAFVSISLVVSSIMIGIITYISVLERTKEIGVLRALGARKRDISRVFNAETLLIGFSAGFLGVLISWLLTFPASYLAERATGIANIAVLPIWGAVALVAISMLLTFIAGTLPSRIAANKDPVVALRSE
jgi:putative ABC transport system permease protein